MAELTRALHCLAQTGTPQCTHITIPAGTTIPFCDTIGIGNEHVQDGGLTLTNGTLLWVREAAPDQGSTPALININGARAGPVTINGSGSILSIHEPCRMTNIQGVCIEPNADAESYIANGIRIINSDDVTVSGVINVDGTHGPPLKFQKLSTAILVESDTSGDLDFINLKIEGMTQYGAWVGAAADDAKVSGVTITNCHVQGAYGQHGFRIYANHVTITNCTSCRHRATGLWVVQGKDIDVNDFQTNEYVRIGPNYECNGGGGPEKGERLMDALINNINALYIEVTGGVIGCQLTDLTAQTTGAHGLSIGTTPGENTVARPTNRVHWSGLQGNTSVGISEGCEGTDINVCPADVDDDGIVDVDDLIAVILNWGPCTPVGACWFDNICHPHWTAQACGTAGGEYQGDGTDCWTHPADAPCCKLNNNVWTCEENVLPSACWGSNPPRKYLGDQTSCAGVNCVTAISTMPACNAPCQFPQFPCAADINPVRFGDLDVNVDDLIAVILNWGCEWGEGGIAGEIPENLQDCMNMCNECCYAEYGECLQRCLQALCERGQTQYCD